MAQALNNYIEVKGTKFYNDRFYLNDLVDIKQKPKSVCESQSDDEATTSTTTLPSDTQFTPPPLLNRSDLISSLDLICVIAGTYTFDPIWLHQELPFLFPEPECLSNKRYQDENNNNKKVVPTLLLHGANDSTIKKISQTLYQNKTKDIDQTKSSDAWNNPLFGNSVSIFRVLPTWISPSASTKSYNSDKYTQDNQDSKSTKRFQGVHHPKYWLLFEKRGSLVVMISTQNLTKPTSVDATWVQRFEPNELYRLKKKSQTSPSIYEQKYTEPKMHDSLRHPNCNGQDFGWVLMDFLIKSQKAIAVNKSNIANSSSNQNHSDLSNILLCNHHSFQSIILDFIKKHIHEITTWEDFAQIYNFQDASVYLVSTVPGYYLGSFHSFLPSNHTYQNSQTINESSNIPKEHKKHTMLCLYGPQRVRDILNRLQKPMPTSHYKKGMNSAEKMKSSKCNPNKRKRFGQRGIDRWNDAQSEKTYNRPTIATSMPWLPCTGFMTENDRLIMQPTSLGGNWTYSSLDQLVRYYLQQVEHCKESSIDNKNAKNTAIEREQRNMNDENDYVERTDIIWPSFDFVNFCKSRKKNPKAQDKIFEESYSNTCNVFLSSNTFNSISVDCISRMALYEESFPPQLMNSMHFNPHIKSYGRLLSFNSIFDEHSLNHKFKNAEYFAWFMITSACLSKGAQGQPTPEKEFGSDSFTYSNFELGILFPSRLQGNSNTDRIYAWKPSSHLGTKYVRIDDILRRDKMNVPVSNKRRNMDDDKVTSLTKTTMNTALEVIHLPIPYKLKATSYMDDPEEIDMSHTPYFHEIEPNSAAAGNMRLTPLGKKISELH